MPIYMTCQPDGTPTRWFRASLGQYNTAEDAKKNGKPFICEADVIDPPVGDDQVREGPALAYDPKTNRGTVTYTVRDKTAQELNAEKTARARQAAEASGVQELIAALNDGSFVPGSGYTDDEIRTILKGKLRAQAR